MSDEIRPFHLVVPEEVITDLHDRLDRTRWPDKETGPTWAQGVPLDEARALRDYWRHSYDWRRCEAQLNDLGQFKTQIDGLDIHFLHIRSPHEGALPLVLTHGWPASIVEFVKLVGPLTDPTRYGGSPSDAFHLVIPSLPGYGFSGRPTKAGWDIARIGRAWITLMRRLGYSRYVAQGGDWGAAVTLSMANQDPPEMAGMHLNLLFVSPSEADLANLSAQEQKARDDMRRFRAENSAYSALQSTKPQTLAYGLADSPMAQATWIYEKFREWMDCKGDPLSVLTYDELLDNIMIYWVTGTGSSSARLYWESFKDLWPRNTVVPLAYSRFPGEISRPSRAWVERRFPNLYHWSEPPVGGHFAAAEQPEIFVNEMRNAFRPIRLNGTMT